MHHLFGRKAIGFAAAASAFILSSFTSALGQSQPKWLSGGNDLSNSRNAATERKISAANAGTLVKKWEFATAGDVSATPTVDTTNNGDATLYVPDWAGNLYCINAKTGVSIWTKPLSDYTGNPNGSVSRTSPAISGNQIVFGDQGDLNSDGFPQGSGATASVMSVNKTTGSLNWRTVVSDHVFSIITSCPIIYNGIVYVGVSSLEENAGFVPGWVFSFRGKVVALDAKTGAILWSFKTISDKLAAQGYTGASVWGSTPVVDTKRGSLYVGTGNNYSAPEGIGNPNNPAVADADDHIDSVLALDLNSGKLKWSTRMMTADTWDVFRAFISQYDAADLGPDYDFGSAPNLFTAKDGSDLLGAGQKSGAYWALNPSTGKVVWKTQVGPGGTGGGIEWGSAVDGKRVYCAITNSDYKSLTPFGLSGVGGMWAGLDAATGSVIWRTADPLGGHDPGAVSVANGVLFAGSAGLSTPFAPGGQPGVPGGFFALNAATGSILWSYPIDGSVNSGPSIVDGTVYWGSGYSHLTNAFGISGGWKLYAFSLP